MKFNSQICTTRVQSERLLALGLKNETADCRHWAYTKDSKGTPIPKKSQKWVTRIGADESAQVCGFMDTTFIPAWSLHRLKCLLPEKTPYGDGYLTVEIINENVYIVLVIENVEQRVLKYTKGNLYDNLISCVNFFVKESLFNKEYLEE